MKREHYPIPQVEQPNLEYAYLLEQDYAGPVSEDTAIHLYLYQHMVDEGLFPEFSEALHDIMITEMYHLELLGETIRLLGKEPRYQTTDPITGSPKYWNASYVNYTTQLKEMLTTDIISEETAIRNYEAHREIIHDKYIKELLTRIIQDEQEHLTIFKKFYQTYILR